MVQIFEPVTRRGRTPFIGTEGDILGELIVPTDFKRFLVLCPARPPDLLALDNGNEHLRDWISNAVRGAVLDASEGNRLVGQRLTIEAASALEVRYKYEGKKYRAWFVGWEYRVHAPNSPVTDALTGKVENAVERWKRGDRRRAASQLREVIDMTRVDDACRMAYLSVRDTVPNSLVSKAKWLRWRPYIVAAALAAGIVFVSLLVIGVRSVPRAKTTAPHAPPTKAERDKAKAKRP